MAGCWLTVVFPVPICLCLSAGSLRASSPFCALACLQEKEPYQKKAEKDKARYEKEKAAYEG